MIWATFEPRPARDTAKYLLACSRCDREDDATTYVMSRCLDISDYSKSRLDARFLRVLSIEAPAKRTLTSLPPSRLMIPFPSHAYNNAIVCFLHAVKLHQSCTIVSYPIKGVARFYPGLVSMMLTSASFAPRFSALNASIWLFNSVATGESC